MSKVVLPMIFGNFVIRSLLSPCLAKTAIATHAVRLRLPRCAIFLWQDRTLCIVPKN